MIFPKFAPLKTALIQTFSTVGSRHIDQGLACQDAVAVESELHYGKNNWMVVADGCSGSRYAEQGSKDMAEIAAGIFQKNRSNFLDTDLLEQQLINGLSERNYLYPYMFSSTLVSAQVLQSRALISFFGDGSVLTLGANGVWRETTITYTSSYPRFLHYFCNSAQGPSENSKHDAGWARLIYPPQVCVAHHKTTDEWGTKWRKENLSLSSPFTVEIDLDAQDICALAICTDGVMDSACSLGKALMQSAQSKDLVDSLNRARAQAGFSHPGDDATLALMTFKS